MRRYSLDVIVVILLLCVYTTSALLLSVIGAQVYRQTADTMRYNYNNRTSILYIAEKVRHNDLVDSVRIDRVNGADALVLVERQSGRNYEVWMFVQDNILYEGVFAPGDWVDTSLCQSILPMESMRVSWLEGSMQMIHVSLVTIDGQTDSIDLMLRTSREPGA